MTISDFFANKPDRVTKSEFKEIMSRLYGKLEPKERDEVEKVFRGDLDEPGLEEGITKPEFEATMAWLEANMSKHELEADDLALIREYFAEHLED